MSHPSHSLQKHVEGIIKTFKQGKSQLPDIEKAVLAETLKYLPPEVLAEMSRTYTESKIEELQEKVAKDKNKSKK